MTMALSILGSAISRFLQTSSLQFTRYYPWRAVRVSRGTVRRIWARADPGKPITQMQPRIAEARRATVLRPGFATEAYQRAYPRPLSDPPRILTRPPFLVR